MSAPARLNTPLDPLYLAGRWSQPFVVYDEDAEGNVTDADLTGWYASLSLVRRGLPAAARQLTVGAGLTMVSANTVLAVREATEQAGWLAGTYDLELQLIDPDARPFSLLVGVIPVVLGPAAAIRDGATSVGALPGAATVARTVGIVRSVTGAVRLIRVAGGGVPTDARFVRWDDSKANLGVTNLQDALDLVIAGLKAGQLDFSDPGQSGLLTVL